MSVHSPSYIWNYDISEQEFKEILAGERVIGRLDQDWAALRLLEYAPYEVIFSLLRFACLVQNWQRWRQRIRSQSRKRGFDFLVTWLPVKHPEVCCDEMVTRKIRTDDGAAGMIV